MEAAAATVATTRVFTMYRGSDRGSDRGIN